MENESFTNTETVVESVENSFVEDISTNTVEITETDSGTVIDTSSSSDITYCQIVDEQFEKIETNLQVLSNSLILCTSFVLALFIFLFLHFFLERRKI